MDYVLAHYPLEEYETRRCCSNRFSYVYTSPAWHGSFCRGFFFMHQGYFMAVWMVIGL